MKHIRNLMFMAVFATFGIALTGCNSNPSNGQQKAEEENVEGAKMEIVLYNDDTGSIFDENKQRICGFELSGGRTGTMRICTSTEIDLFGANTRYLYIKGNYAYVEFGDALRDKTENGISVKKIEKGSEIHFYLIPGANVSNTQNDTSKEENLSETTSEEETSASTTTWTGASSIEELKQKLNDTYWHINCGGRMYMVHFTNGGVMLYFGLARDGEWANKEFYSSYEVETKRDSGGHNFVSVSFGNDVDSAIDGHYIVAFASKCMIAVLFQHGSPYGQLTYGEYKWNDEL